MVKEKFNKPVEQRVGNDEAKSGMQVKDGKERVDGKEKEIINMRSVHC